jgi:hypothetical protein
MGTPAKIIEQISRGGLNWSGLQIYWRKICSNGIWIKYKLYEKLPIFTKGFQLSTLLRG